MAENTGLSTHPQPPLTLIEMGSDGSEARCYRALRLHSLTLTGQQSKRKANSSGRPKHPMPAAKPPDPGRAVGALGAP